VCIPYSIVPVIFNIYHNSIIGGYVGLPKAFLMLRCIFHIRSLYQLLVEFTSSCHKCQIMKADRNPELPYQVNIPVEYRPFSEVHIYVKHMPPGIEGYRYILVATCSIARYMVAIP
jgi:hypothetical protein